MFKKIQLFSIEKSSNKWFTSRENGHYRFEVNDGVFIASKEHIADLLTNGLYTRFAAFLSSIWSDLFYQ